MQVIVINTDKLIFLFNTGTNSTFSIFLYQNWKINCWIFALQWNSTNSALTDCSKSNRL